MGPVKQIAFICQPYHRGGVTRWMADAAIAFAAKGLDVFFVTVAPSKPFVSGMDAETMIGLLEKTKNNVKLVSRSVGSEFELGTPEYRAYIYQELLIENVAAGTPLILSDDAVIWSAAASLYLSYPSIGVLHSDEKDYYNLAAKYHEKVAGLACVSGRICNTLKRRSPEIDTTKIFTIPCGIVLPAPTTRTQTSELLKIVYVGRINEYPKRTSDLLTITRILIERGKAFHINIIGDGGIEKTQLEGRFAAEKLLSYVTFTGWLTKDNVQDYLYESDVLVLMSSFEGMPISMMEALASGCGFTGTRVSGIEDYENHPLARDCFRVYTTGELDDAVDKIVQLGDIPLPTRQVAARSLAELAFSMDSCLNRYLEAIPTIGRHYYRKGNAVLPVIVAIRSKCVAIIRTLKLKLSHS